MPCQCAHTYLSRANTEATPSILRPRQAPNVRRQMKRGWTVQRLTDTRGPCSQPVDLFFVQSTSILAGQYERAHVSPLDGGRSQTLSAPGLILPCRPSQTVVIKLQTYLYLLPLGQQVLARMRAVVCWW